MRIAHFLCLSLLLVLASCGGSSVTPLQSSSGILPDSLIDAGLRSGLPPMPDDVRFQLGRMTAAVSNEASLPGAQTQSDLRTAINGANRDFTSLATGVAYGLYAFTGAPGEEIDAIRVEASALSPGGTIYVALGNYASSRWEFLAPTTQLVTTFNLPGATADYTSPVSGSIFVLVALYGGDTCTLDRVVLNFPDRHAVSGIVRDLDSVGIPGVLIGTGIPGQSAITDAQGNFAINGLPDGNWNLVATSHTYTFYDNPRAVTLAGNNVSNIIIIGAQNGSNFVPRDPLGPNQSFQQAVPLDLTAGAHYDSLSSLDDRSDFFRVNFPTAGSYLIEFDNPAHDIYYPVLEVLQSQFFAIAWNSSVWSGKACVGLHVAFPGDYIVAVHANTGGAGEYSLSMQQTGWAILQGNVQTAVLDLAGARLQVVEDNSGATSIYHMDPFAMGGGVWGDDFRPLQDCTITPLSPHYTYAPPLFNAALSGGDVWNADFFATAVPVGDSFEPNNTALDADVNAVLTLPYNSVGNDDLSCGEFDDRDIYRVEPALGLGMRVVVEFTDFGPGTSQPANLEIWDSLFNQVTFGDYQNGRLYCDLPILADGNQYYIVITPTTANRTAEVYTLNVMPYMAQNLVIQARVDGVGLGNAEFQVRQEGFGAQSGFVTYYRLFTDMFGDTFPMLVPEGSEVFVEAMRYGVEFHRQTQRSLVPNGPLTLVFNSSSANNLDSFEPNDDLSTAPALPSMPVSFTSTLDGVHDFGDSYSLLLPTADPLQITLNSSAPDAGLTLLLFDDLLNFLDVAELRNGITRSIDPQGSGIRIVQIFGGLTETSFDLSFEQGPAFRIDGNVVDSAFLMPIPSAIVYCREINERVYPDLGTGDFMFPLVTPGTYTIDFWAAGYLLQTSTVIVTNADETENVQLVFDPASDNYEPNDAVPMAVLLPADGTSSLPCTTSPIDPDFFKFNGTAGMLYGIRIEWPERWFEDTYIMNVESPTMGSMGSSFNFGAGFQEVVFTAPENGEYVIEIGTFGNGSEYQVRIVEI